MSKTEPGRGRRRILVVEDHPDTQSAVAEYLTNHGFEVQVASNGHAALRLLREERPDLVYLDLNLPHISGYDVCEWIRTDPALRDLAILMTSARGSIDVKAYSLDAGADAYLAKPYDLDRLTEVIEQILISSETRAPASSP